MIPREKNEQISSIQYEVLAILGLNTVGLGVPKDDTAHTCNCVTNRQLKQEEFHVIN